jgi:hypothetical protein
VRVFVCGVVGGWGAVCVCVWGGGGRVYVCSLLLNSLGHGEEASALGCVCGLSGGGSGGSDGCTCWCGRESLIVYIMHVNHKQHIKNGCTVCEKASLRGHDARVHEAGWYGVYLHLRWHNACVHEAGWYGVCLHYVGTMLVCMTLAP